MEKAWDISEIPEGNGGLWRPIAGKILEINYSWEIFQLFDDSGG
jgi:hypothetical protein